MRSPIVIAGAGIGGLTAALALAVRGIDCLILEKAPVLAAVGAGVQLSPNASHILIDLGLGDDLARSAIQPKSVALNSVRAGGEIAHLPLRHDARAPYWVVHRADLQTALLRAVAVHPRVTLRLGADVTGFKHHSDGVHVLTGGEVVEAAALIAADGVRSTIRQQLFPDAAAVPAGRAAWRGLAQRNAAATDTDVQLWMGPRAHLVAYPVMGGEQTNFVVTLPDGASELSERPGADVAAQLRRAGWSRAVCDLVAAVDRLIRYELLTVPDMATWNMGRIALLGDAAHAILPFAAQGAAMAIEDAVVLAQCIGDRGSDVPAALARYTQQRKPRLARVAATARQSGLIYHLRGPMAAARDLAIRGLGARRLLQRQDWIYDWRV